MLSSLAEVLADVLFDPVGVVGAVRDRRRERRARRTRRAAMVPCALRVVDGSHPGLGRRWIRGAARVPPGALVFQPDSTWRRERITVVVRSATLQSRGTVPRRGRRQPAGTRLITVLSDAATLEWRVPEDLVHRSMGVALPRPVDVSTGRRGADPT